MSIPLVRITNLDSAIPFKDKHGVSAPTTPIRLLCLSVVCLLAGCSGPETKEQNWPSYLADKASSQYSTLSQIHRDNVQELQIAWTFGEARRSSNNRNQMECNPLIIDGVLYGTTSKLIVVALDAATGAAALAI